MSNADTILSNMTKAVLLYIPFKSVVCMVRAVDVLHITHTLPDHVGGCGLCTVF